VQAANAQGGDAGERTGDNAEGGHDLSFLPVGWGDVKRGGVTTFMATDFTA
jgi:hypothetical protein